MKFEKHTTNLYSVKLPNGEILTVNQSGYDAINALMAEAKAEIAFLRGQVRKLAEKLDREPREPQTSYYNDLEPTFRFFRED